MYHPYCKAYEGTTCTCHNPGDPVLCVMDAHTSDLSSDFSTSNTQQQGGFGQAGPRRNFVGGGGGGPRYPPRGQQRPVYNYQAYSDYSSSQQGYSDDSAGQVNFNSPSNQTQQRYYDYGNYYPDYYPYGPSFTQYSSYGQVCVEYSLSMSNPHLDDRNAL